MKTRDEHNKTVYFSNYEEYKRFIAELEASKTYYQFYEKSYFDYNYLEYRFQMAQVDYIVS